MAKHNFLTGDEDEGTSLREGSERVAVRMTMEKTLRGRGGYRDGG